MGFWDDVAKAFEDFAKHDIPRMVKWYAEPIEKFFAYDLGQKVPNGLENFVKHDLAKVMDVLEKVVESYGRAHDANARSGSIRPTRDIPEDGGLDSSKTAQDLLILQYFRKHFFGMINFILTYDEKNGGVGSFFKNHNITDEQAGVFTNFVSGYWNQTKLIAEHNKAQQCESYYSPSFVFGAATAVGAACLLVGGVVSSAITYYCAKRHYAPVSQDNNKA